MVLYACYNWRLKVLSQQKNLVLGLTQENSMEFLSTMYLLIYAGLLVYTTLNLAYPKEHVYYILLTYSMILLF